MPKESDTRTYAENPQGFNFSSLEGLTYALTKQANTPDSRYSGDKVLKCFEHYSLDDEALRLAKIFKESSFPKSYIPKGKSFTISEAYRTAHKKHPLEGVAKKIDGVSIPDNLLYNVVPLLAFEAKHPGMARALLISDKDGKINLEWQKDPTILNISNECGKIIAKRQKRSWTDKIINDPITPEPAADDISFNYDLSSQSKAEIVETSDSSEEHLFYANEGNFQKKIQEDLASIETANFLKKLNLANEDMIKTGERAETRIGIFRDGYHLSSAGIKTYDRFSLKKEEREAFIQAARESLPSELKRSSSQASLDSLEGQPPLKNNSPERAYEEAMEEELTIYEKETKIIEDPFLRSTFQNANGQNAMISKDETGKTAITYKEAARWASNDNPYTRIVLPENISLKFANPSIENVFEKLGSVCGRCALEGNTMHVNLREKDRSILAGKNTGSPTLTR